MYEVYATLPPNYERDYGQEEHRHITPPIIISAYICDSLGETQIASTRIADGLSVTRWNYLADACQHGDNYSQKWDLIYGRFTISICNATCTFTMTANSEDEELYSNQYKIPAHVCARAFTHAAQITQEWHDNVRPYGHKN